MFANSAWQCVLNVSYDFDILSIMFLKLVFLKKKQRVMTQKLSSMFDDSLRLL